MKDTAVYIIGLTIALIVCNDWISITLPIFATFIFFNRQKALKEHEKTLDLLKKLSDSNDFYIDNNKKRIDNIMEYITKKRKQNDSDPT